MPLKHYALSAFIAILIFFSSVVQVKAELIQQFNSDIVVNKNGTIDVVETIVYDFENEHKHGIYRDVPLIKKGVGSKKFLLKMSGVKVEDENGDAYKMEKSVSNNTLRLKIGDASTTLTGQHVYRILYTVAGALSYFKDHDELYWNITGNDWQVPIQTASSTIKLPSALPKDKVGAVCYTGTSGSTENNCITTFDGDTFRASTNNVLRANQGITVAVSFPKGTTAILQAKEYMSFFDTAIGRVVITAGLIVGSILAILWYIVYPFSIIAKWYKEGRDPQVSTGVVTAGFDPPRTQSKRTLTPAETGTLVDETVHGRDITALLIDLARRGYLTIEECKKNDFYLLQKKQPDTRLMSFEQELLEGIFSGKKEIKVSSANLYTTFEKVRKLIYVQVTQDKFFQKNPESIRTFYGLMAGAAGITANIPLLITALTFGFFMPKKTVLGREQANVAQSLKNFLSSQERQLTYQADKQLFFEKLLPYAVAFGVEKKWANRFKELHLKEPSWYHGHSGGSFNSAIFVANINSLGNSFAPATSSSGMSGGSSGGGGGGGGGGSW